MKPYYQDDACILYHGDCNEVFAWMLHVDAEENGLKTFEHVITDPPYSEKTQRGARTRKGQGKEKGGKQGFDFSISEEELRTAFDWSARFCNRWFIAFCDVVHAVALQEKPPEQMRFIRIGVWIKPDGAPQFTGDRPAMGWEAIAIMHREDEEMRWNGGGGRAVFTHALAGDRGLHPTPKPLKLMTEIIDAFTDPGDTILDPFCGSGSTLRAAKDLGRKAIGIEIEERYCEIAAKRLSQEVLFKAEGAR